MTNIIFNYLDFLCLITPLIAAAVITVVMLIFSNLVNRLKKTEFFSKWYKIAIPVILYFVLYIPFCVYFGNIVPALRYADSENVFETEPMLWSGFTLSAILFTVVFLWYYGSILIKREKRIMTAITVLISAFLFVAANSVASVEYSGGKEGFIIGADAVTNSYGTLCTAVNAAFLLCAAALIASVFIAAVRLCIQNRADEDEADLQSNTGDALL